MSLRPIILCLLAFVQFTAPAAADVRLPGIISDHMLLQRDAPVRIFGQATPGEAVSVTFGGQTSRATTDPLGRWEAWLPPLTPGPASNMTIQGTNTITITDVLVGDVWVGSGQSNMQWAVRQSDNADAEIAAASCSDIRLFYVPRKPAPAPVDDVDARWVVCSPETIGEFSAVMYFFGREMHHDLKVPMGRFTRHGVEHRSRRGSADRRSRPTRASNRSRASGPRPSGSIPITSRASRSPLPPGRRMVPRVRGRRIRWGPATRTNRHRSSTG